MSETSFASLNPSLLARKGGAKPAMRPQHGTLAGLGAGAGMSDSAAPNLEDLGWNDMGDEPEVREAEILQLTPASDPAPAPVSSNADTAAQAADNEAEAQAELAAPDSKPAVREQQDQLEDRLAQPASPASARKTAQPVQAQKKAKKRKSKSTAAQSQGKSQGKRAAFTLRLDAQRHLKLRLASTIKGRSAQSIVTEALDAMLAKIDNLESLAAQVGRK